MEATVRVSCHRTYGTGNINGSSKVYSDLKISPQWQQVWFPFTADEGSLVRTDARIEISTATGENYIYWAGWKLEKGTIATDWSPSTEDTIAEMNGTIVSVIVDYAVGNSTSIAPSTG